MTAIVKHLLNRAAYHGVRFVFYTALLIAVLALILI